MHLSKEKLPMVILFIRGAQIILLRAKLDDEYLSCCLLAIENYKPCACPSENTAQRFKKGKVSKIVIFKNKIDFPIVQ